MELELQTQGITEEMMRELPSSLIGGPVGERSENAWEALKSLKRVYSSTIGYDYMHIEAPGNGSGFRRLRKRNDTCLLWMPSMPRICWNG